MAEPKPIHIPIIGLLVEKKTDLLAAAAFLMALVAATVQLYHFSVGPSVTLFAPEQAMLIFEKLPDNRRVFRIAARMAYANDGQPGYNGTVLNETVSFTLNNREYVQKWQSEHRFSAPDGELKKDYIAEARPVPVTAGSSISREIYFASYPERCRRGQSDCDHDKQFIFDGEATRLLSQLETLELRFSSTLLGEDEPLTVSCVVDLTAAVMDGLVVRGWAAPPCWPVKQSS